VNGGGSRSVTRSRADKGGRAIRPPPGELLYNEIRIVENTFADFAAPGEKYVSIVASRATCRDVYSELPPGILRVAALHPHKRAAVSVRSHDHVGQTVVQRAADEY